MRRRRKRKEGIRRGGRVYVNHLMGKTNGIFKHGEVVSRDIRLVRLYHRAPHVMHFPDKPVNLAVRSNS